MSRLFTQSTNNNCRLQRFRIYCLASYWLRVGVWRVASKEFWCSI